MIKDIENYKQSKYWNETTVQDWVDLDNSLNERFSQITQKLFENTYFKKDSRVLDIGCGSGYTTKYISDKITSHGRVVGIDLSCPLLELSKKKYNHCSNIKFINADAQNYKFKKKYFEYVFSRFGVMFFEDPVKAFINIKRSMKSGAIIKFVCWHSLKKNDFFTIPIRAVRKSIKIDYPKENNEPGPFAFSDKSYIKSILERSGYHNIKITNLNTSILTSDLPEVNSDLLMKIGIGARLIRDEKITLKKRLIIKKAIENISKHKTINNLISYNACVNIVEANILL